MGINYRIYSFLAGGSRRRVNLFKSTQAGDRGTVRRNRNNNTVTKNGIKYINEDIFIYHFPGAVIKEGATFQLNKEQLANLPDNPKS